MGQENKQCASNSFYNSWNYQIALSPSWQTTTNTSL